MARLTAASSLSGVDRPCRALMRVGADEGDVDAQGVEHPQRLLADGGLRDARGPVRRAVAASPSGIAASRAAMGTELVTTTSSRSVGSRAAMRAVVVPASSSTLAPLRGKNSVAAAAMASL